MFVLQYFRYKKPNIYKFNILQDVINFEEFTNHMTNDEQQRLLKYLTPVDTVQVPNRFESYLVKL